jgi:hypothetical protein
VETNYFGIGCAHDGFIERPAGTNVPFSKERPNRRSRNLFSVHEALFNLLTQQKLQKLPDARRRNVGGSIRVFMNVDLVRMSIPNLVPGILLAGILAQAA